MMRFWKMNGAGNDFVVLNNLEEHLPTEVLPQVARTLCERHLSIGADGLMVVDAPTQGGDYKMLFFNSDGSVGEMCGNGARCICRYAYDLGIAPEKMVVETDAGLVPGQRLSEDIYRVRLNNHSILDLHRKDNVAYAELGNPGVPHAVAAYTGDLWADKEALRESMRALRYDAAFPKGANVNFYQWISDGEIRVLTFERGVEDFTLACGTGCGSTASVLWLEEKLPGSTLTAHNRGGTLKVTIGGEGDTVTAIELEGPTEVVKVLEI